MKKYWLITSLVLFIFFSLSMGSCLSATLHISEKYSEVLVGGRVYFEISVNFPENNVRKDLQFEYEIKNEEGKIIAKSKVLKAIETQASFIDFIVIPIEAETGFHTLEITIKDYENLEEKVGSSFHIARNNLNQIEFYFYLLLGSIFLVGSLVIFSIFIRRK